MTAQAMHGEPGIDDPMEILRVLPSEYHQQFRAEYAAAVAEARDPAGYRAPADLLRLWELRAVAYSDPGYRDRFNAARAGDATDVPSEEVVTGWLHR